MKEAVKVDLNRDIRLGILVKVDINLPIKWLYRMIVTLKKDRTTRRIIDYKRLNDAIPRKTNITQSMFMCASACPPHKKKTLLDAEDGYYSLICLDSDQAYTEFLCKFGRYRCIESGQGLICSGNAYTARFDKIMQDFTNVVWCVDDSLIWADNVRNMFYSTCRYISVCAKGGINFKKKKIEFSQNEVEYVGFKISIDAIIPADIMTEAIRNFPQPKISLMQELSSALSNRSVLHFQNVMT